MDFSDDELDELEELLEQLELDNEEHEDEDEEVDGPCVICNILDDNKEHVDSVGDYILQNFANENYKEPDCSRKVRDKFENEIPDFSLFKKILGEKQYERFLNSIVFISSNADHLVLLLSMFRNVFIPLARTYETLLLSLPNTPNNKGDKE